VAQILHRCEHHWRKTSGFILQLGNDAVEEAEDKPIILLISTTYYPYEAAERKFRGYLYLYRRITMANISILIIPPGETPYPAEIPHTLDSLQSIVGGDIEVLYPFDDPVGVVCNEHGKLFGQPLNRALRDDSGRIYDIIAGMLFIIGLGIDDFESVSDVMLEKYTAIFRCPEKFIKINGEIHAIPL